MTKDEAVKELVECQEIWDAEEAHMKADAVLCNLLESLGYSEVVKEYDEIRKWYA